MNSEANDLSGAEDFVSIFVKTRQPIDGLAEKNVRDNVGKADGVVADSLHISERTITLCYDPARISQAQLATLLKRAGLEAEEVKFDRAPLA